jgi:hypothetical protein
MALIGVIGKQIAQSAEHPKQNRGKGNRFAGTSKSDTQLYGGAVSQVRSAGGSAMPVR